MTSPSPQPTNAALPIYAKPALRLTAHTPALTSQIHHLTLEAQVAAVACHNGIDLLHNSRISTHDALLWYFDAQMEIALLFDPAPADASQSQVLTHLKRLARTLPLPPQDLA